MNTETNRQMPEKIHHGRNVRRLREIFDIKQKTLGDGIGKSQQTISRIETNRVLDDDVLTIIAGFYGISIKSIKSFDNEYIKQMVKLKLNSNDNSVENEKHHNYTFNSFANESKVSEEKVNVYEQSSKAEKNEIVSLAESAIPILKKIIDLADDRKSATN